MASRTTPITSLTGCPPGSFSTPLLAANYCLKYPQLNLSASSWALKSNDGRRVKKMVRSGEQGSALLVTEPAEEAIREKPVTNFRVTANVTLKIDMKERLKDLLLDFNTPGKKKNVVLQLVSTEIDPGTTEPMRSEEATLDWSRDFDAVSSERVSYNAEFVLDSSFGVPGAITVKNNYDYEIYLESVTFEGVTNFSCNSWVQPAKDHPRERIFFASKALLPGHQTPMALQELRQEELRQLRGDKQEMRRPSDRIYDYDVYNDLGKPDRGREFARPIMGGKAYPYPRRCRTGRPPTSSDWRAESTTEEDIYVPRDEAFGEVKRQSMNAGKLKGIISGVAPTLKTVSEKCDAIKCFSDINRLYKEKPSHGTESPLTMLIGKIKDPVDNILKFDPPDSISRDATNFFRDDEFARQTLAGVNPLSIERLKVFPPESKLDPSSYGSQASALREEHIISHLDGMSVQQALKENKLYVLDYHDLYLPFLHRINALGNRKSYATRTIFVLTGTGTLKPIAIELCLPQCDASRTRKRVITPPTDATSNWFWQLAKAHVCSNDTGVHQLIHHWLRTHACIEPFIIAAHRQLSVMHPVYKLLDPHMRYTLAINAEARKHLLSAEGIMESLFSSGMYAMEMTSSVYRKWWRFDMESLPADLIRRGVAVPDPTKEHGLRLLIEDYPYANDGLLVWSAIERLVTTYVNYYYPDECSIESDSELQAWYYEAVNVGHADLRHKDWWPKLSRPEDLVNILTTLIWIVSTHHAAVNFGQYMYGAFVPWRPPMMRRLVPEEHDPEYAELLRDPQRFFLSALPSLYQISYYMSALHILSTHSPDEEYLGDQRDLSSWSGDCEIIHAFYRFFVEMKVIHMTIQKRNTDPKLPNRCGAGISPYELLIPSSKPGVTSRGVPNSVSI